MTDSIENVFASLQLDIDNYINYASTELLHNSSKNVVEAWANNIINMLMDQNLEPLSEKTIERRKRRGQDILGPDYALLETGEWVTYIEFKINQFYDHDEIEVGVFDESTKIGHTLTKTPAYIAEINEYGWEDVNIPARNLFSISELKIDTQLDSIINETWDKLIVPETTELVIKNLNNLIGRIYFDGSFFIFRWDE